MSEPGDTCPNCGVANFIPGEGSTVYATTLSEGRYSEASGGVDGAKSKYRCLRCGCEWIVPWPDGSVFLAGTPQDGTGASRSDPGSGGA